MTVGPACQEASLIAYELLAPEEMIHDYFRPKWWRKPWKDPLGDDVIIGLSKKLGLPIVAVMMRLRQLGYWDPMFELQPNQEGGRDDG